MLLTIETNILDFLGVHKKYNNLSSYMLRWSTVIFKYQHIKKMHDLQPTKASLHVRKIS